MNKWYHCINGRVYGGVGFEMRHWSEKAYRNKLKELYGSLRGVQITTAENIKEAESFFGV